MHSTEQTTRAHDKRQPSKAAPPASTQPQQARPYPTSGVVGLARAYPIAAVAAAGLIVGAALLPVSSLASRVAFGAVLLLGGVPLAWSTVRNMAAGRFYVDTIATLAVLGAAVTGEYLAGALVVLMQSGGEALDDYGLRRANRSLDKLLSRAPSVAHRREGEGFVDVRAGDLAIGDIILVRTGDIIAADGVVLEGQGSVDEAALTGEPIPLPKLPGDAVYSGTINLHGSFLVRTVNTAAESKYELIVRMVQRAQGEKAPINRLANRYTPAFTLLTLAVAGGALLFTRDPSRALAVLVVATPCPLIIATPLAVLSAINRAASLNIIVKSGAAIEQAGSVDALVFDKTGTLTSGEPALTEVPLLAGAVETGLTEDTLLEGAASVEMLSAHVVAHAVVQAARGRGLPIVAATDSRETPGTGVSGVAGGRRFAIGSGHFLHSEGVPVGDAAQRQRSAIAADGKTVAYLAVDGRLAALLVFEDRVRPEAPALLRRLRDMGIERTVMLTGDAPESAQSVADGLGIAEVRWRMRPDEKLEQVRALAERHTVMMIGDGINDAPALAAADVGVAMGSYGAGIATDAADIVITVENVERVADVIALGRRMTRVATQGILFGMGASLVLMVLATLGFIRPAVGAFLQEALDLAAILNAFRAR